MFRHYENKFEFIEDVKKIMERINDINKDQVDKLIHDVKGQLNAAFTLKFLDVDVADLATANSIASECLITCRSLLRRNPAIRETVEKTMSLIIRGETNEWSVEGMRYNKKDRRPKTILDLTELMKFFSLCSELAKKFTKYPMLDGNVKTILTLLCKIFCSSVAVSSELTNRENYLKLVDDMKTADKIFRLNESLADLDSESLSLKCNNDLDFFSFKSVEGEKIFKKWPIDDQNDIITADSPILPCYKYDDEHIITEKNGEIKIFQDNISEITSLEYLTTALSLLPDEELNSLYSSLPEALYIHSVRSEHIIKDDNFRDIDRSIYKAIIKNYSSVYDVSNTLKIIDLAKFRKGSTWEALETVLAVAGDINERERNNYRAKLIRTLSVALFLKNRESLTNPIGLNALVNGWLVKRMGSFSGSKTSFALLQAIEELKSLIGDFSSLWVDVALYCCLLEYTLPTMRQLNVSRLSADENLVSKWRYVLDHPREVSALVRQKILDGEVHAKSVISRIMTSAVNAEDLINHQSLQLNPEDICIDNDAKTFKTNYLINLSKLTDYVDQRKTMNIAIAPISLAVTVAKMRRLDLKELLVVHTFEQQCIQHGVNLTINRESLSEELDSLLKTVRGFPLNDILAKIVIKNDRFFIQAAQDYHNSENYRRLINSFASVRGYNPAFAVESYIEAGDLRLRYHRGLTPTEIITRNSVDLNGLIAAIMPPNVKDIYVSKIDRLTTPVALGKTIDPIVNFNLPLLSPSEYQNIPLQPGFYVILARSEKGKSKTAQAIAHKFGFALKSHGEPVASAKYSATDFSNMIQEASVTGGVVVDSLKGILSRVGGATAAGGIETGMFTLASQIASVMVESRSYMFGVYLVEEDDAVYGTRLASRLLGSVSGVIWLDNIEDDSGRRLYRYSSSDLRGVRVALREPRRQTFLVAYNTKAQEESNSLNVEYMDSNMVQIMSTIEKYFENNDITSKFSSSKNITNLQESIINPAQDSKQQPNNKEEEDVDDHNMNTNSLELTGTDLSQPKNIFISQTQFDRSRFK